jgi:hypothetical protein
MAGPPIPTETFCQNKEINMHRTNRVFATFILTFAALGCAVSPARGDVLTVLGLNANSEVQGSPGSTVGYGFTFTSHTYYAILNFSEFLPAPSFAAYTDYIASNFITTSPGQPVTESFSLTVDPGTGNLTETGLGQFTIDRDAVVGRSFKGILTLDYDLYSASPNGNDFNPDQDLVSAGNEITADVGIKIVAPATVATPEPAGVGLLATALLLLGAAIKLGNPALRRPGTRDR